MKTLVAISDVEITVLNRKRHLSNLW